MLFEALANPGNPILTGLDDKYLKRQPVEKEEPPLLRLAYKNLLMGPESFVLRSSDSVIMNCQEEI